MVRVRIPGTKIAIETYKLLTHKERIDQNQFFSVSDTVTLDMPYVVTA